MNEHPKHQILRSLGIFLGGLGILLVGIALLMFAIRPPLCRVQNSDFQSTAEPLTAESMIRTLEEMKRVMDDPKVKAALEALGKSDPMKVEEKHEFRPIP